MFLTILSKNGVTPQVHISTAVVSGHDVKVHLGNEAIKLALYCFFQTLSFITLMLVIVCEIQFPCLHYSEGHRQEVLLTTNQGWQAYFTP